MNQFVSQFALSKRYSRMTDSQILLKRFKRCYYKGFDGSTESIPDSDSSVHPSDSYHFMQITNQEFHATCYAWTLVPTPRFWVWGWVKRTRIWVTGLRRVESDGDLLIVRCGSCRNWQLSAHFWARAASSSSQTISRMFSAPGWPG